MVHPEFVEHTLAEGAPAGIFCEAGAEGVGAGAVVGDGGTTQRHEGVVASVHQPSSLIAYACVHPPPPRLSRSVGRGPCTGAGGDHGIATMWNRREISGGSELWSML
jgi:hypothetical protein